jgi:hypothetical protein
LEGKTREKTMAIYQKEGNGMIHMGFCALGQTSPDEALISVTDIISNLERKEKNMIAKLTLILI